MNTAQYTGLTWSILSIRQATMRTDYRIYHTESDGLTKNDHFQAIFMDLLENAHHTL
jgi:hypothetical protein